MLKISAGVLRLLCWGSLLLILSGCSLFSKKEKTGFFYRVQPGETLESIARACDISQWEIRKANKRGATYRPGELIYIPNYNTDLSELVTKPRSFTARKDYFEYREPPSMLKDLPEPIQNQSRQMGSLEVRSRGSWGAGRINQGDIDPMGLVQRITVHHTALLPGMKSKSDAEFVNHVYKYHTKQKGWADIGYHYLIGRDGHLYEGRLEKYQGAHAGKNNNERNLGVALIGDFNQKSPSSNQLRTLEVFLREKMSEYGVSPNKVFGHKDLKATECPGDFLYRDLQKLKSRMKYSAMTSQLPRS